MQFSTSVDHGGAGRVRDEDAFDVAAVAAWLSDHAGIDGTPAVRQFPGGASNLTYLLSYDNLDLVLRRPPAGAKAKSAHDTGREYRIQSGLKPVFGLVPGMVGFCEDAGMIGSDFYVMERLEGTILRKDFPRDWPLSEAEISTLCRNAIDVLVDLHAMDPVAAGLDDLSRGEGYVGSCLIHNDFRFDNLVLAADDPLRIEGVLDWEMATIGDPQTDLSGTLAYWVESSDDEFAQGFRRQPTTSPGMWKRADVLAHYADRTGLSVTPDQRRFYELFALFRLAVIAQRIYYRYFQRQTHNEAYAEFGDGARYFEGRCLALIDA